MPIETSPLAGLDPEEIADPTPLAELIRKGIAAERLETRLGPKVSVIVDGGGRPELDEMTADVRLTAERRNGAVAWQIAVAGNAKTAATLRWRPDRRRRLRSDTVDPRRGGRAGQERPGKGFGA